MIRQTDYKIKVIKAKQQISSAVDDVINVGFGKVEIHVQDGVIKTISKTETEKINIKKIK